MTISKELFLSILAMDAYNHGYDEGVKGLGGVGASIGNATIESQSSVRSDSPEIAAGFYALSYTISGSGTDLDDKTVISYPGTDANVTPFGISGSDLVHGYGLARGDGGAI